MEPAKDGCASWGSTVIPVYRDYKRRAKNHEWDLVPLDTSNGALSHLKRIAPCQGVVCDVGS